MVAASLVAAQPVYATTLASAIPAVRKSFPLDHAIKLVLFVLAIESLSRVLHAFERLAGYDVQPVIQNAYLARTVGEFWCRYNTRVHAWFVYNVSTDPRCPGTYSGRLPRLLRERSFTS